MNIKFFLKNIWLAVGVTSLVLLGFHWFEFAPENLLKAIIIFNAITFLLSLPCSLITLPVFIASNHYLEMSPFSSDGIYLNTILLFLVGIMQWYWLINFWSPSEKPFQQLDLITSKKI